MPLLIQVVLYLQVVLLLREARPHLVFPVLLVFQAHLVFLLIPFHLLVLVVQVFRSFQVVQVVLWCRCLTLLIPSPPLFPVFQQLLVVLGVLVLQVVLEDLVCLVLLAIQKDQLLLACLLLPLYPFLTLILEFL